MSDNPHFMPFLIKIVALLVACFLIYRIYAPNGGNYIAMAKLIRPLAQKNRDDTPIVQTEQESTIS